jgi:hypothetical protein
MASQKEPVTRTLRYLVNQAEIPPELMHEKPKATSGLGYLNKLLNVLTYRIHDKATLHSIRDKSVTVFNELQELHV